jgi:hypothetical protein
MKRLFAPTAKPLLIFGLFAAALVSSWGIASAADPNHVAQLRETKKCERCDLSKADLSGADLREASLSGADLSGASLIEADLSGPTYPSLHCHTLGLNPRKSLLLLSFSEPRVCISCVGSSRHKVSFSYAMLSKMRGCGIRSGR